MTVQVSKRIWVKGCVDVTMGRVSGWTFYYSLSGGETSPHRTWAILFFNRHIHAAWFRSPILDICYQGVFVQRKQYYSNMYCLSMERVWTDASVWRPESHALDDGAIDQGCSLTYTCSPPILLRDSLDLSDRTTSTGQRITLRQIQGGGLCVNFIDNMNDYGDQQTRTEQQRRRTRDSNDTHLWDVCGYICYSCGPDGSGRRRRMTQKQIEDLHDRRHRPMAWIPSLSVNTATLECSFILSFDRSRDRGRCIQCLSDVDGFGVQTDDDRGSVDVRNLNDQLSQMMLNH